MASRLVLGCGSVGHDVVSALRERGGDLLVASDEEARVGTLRGEGVPARLVDVTDREAVAAAAGDPGVVTIVAVLGETPARNVAAAAIAADLFPDASLLAYAGENASAADRRRIADIADRVVSPGRSVLEDLRSRLSDGGPRIGDLRRAIAGISGRLAVVTHANPDPDAIASGLALERLATAFGQQAEVCYHGDISHQENRAMVNLLDINLTHLGPGDDLSAYGGFALVDHSRPGINDGLPRDTEVAVVIDHHPSRGPVDAVFRDIRTEVGATSTLLAGYLRQVNLAVSRNLATALLFGIRVDTRAFSRAVSTADLEAAAWLQPLADVDALERIEAPTVSPDTLDVLATALDNREAADGLVTSCVGYVSDPDAIAQAADHLLVMEGVTIALVCGIIEETVYVSARSRGTDVDVGETLREAFVQIGDAGGHAEMAGAQLPLEFVEHLDEADPADVVPIVEDLVANRFREAVGASPTRILPPVSEEAYRDTGE